MEVTKSHSPNNMATSFTYTITETELLQQGARQVLEAVTEAVRKDLTQEFLEKHGKDIMSSIDINSLKEGVVKRLNERLEKAKLSLAKVIMDFEEKKICECGHYANANVNKLSGGYCQSCVHAGGHLFKAMDNLAFVDFYREKEKEIFNATIR